MARSSHNRGTRSLGRFCVLVCWAASGSALAIAVLSASPAIEPIALPQSNNAVGSVDDPATIFREGKQAMQGGQLGVAEADFRKVIALDPKSSAAYVNLGVTYMRQKHWDEALMELKKAEALSPGQPGIQLNIGLAYYRKNDFTAAIEPFSRTLQRLPDSRQARYLLGLCYFFTNKYKEATETLAPLWEGESSNLNYLYVVSIAASKSADTALQAKAFQQMLATGQNTPEFHLYVGKAYLVQDDTAKALQEFHAAAAARPDLPMVHYFLGRTYLEQHAFAQAEAELKKDATIDPDLGYNYEDLGILYAETDQPEKAERAFQRAVELNGTLVNCYFGLAKLYRGQARYPEALAMLDHAESLAPQSASVHFTRAQILARLGQSAKARQEFSTSATLLKSFNDRLQQDPLGVHSADAQDAAQQ